MKTSTTQVLENKKIKELLKKFKEQEKLKLSYPKNKLIACCNKEIMTYGKYSIFIIINEKDINDLMIRDMHNPVVYHMSNSNAPSDCFYCLFSGNIQDNKFLRIIIVDNQKKKGFVYQKETISDELRCPGDWGDDDD